MGFEPFKPFSDADAQAAVRVWAEGSHRVTVRFAPEAKAQ
jgi:hypothetical protein